MLLHNEILDKADKINQYIESDCSAILGELKDGKKSYSELKKEIMRNRPMETNTITQIICHKLLELLEDEAMQEIADKGEHHENN